MARDAAAEATVDRLKREIAKDRVRLAFAQEMAGDGDPAGEPKVGRLFKVIEAMGQNQ
jgi:hypothetical protein